MIKVVNVVGTRPNLIKMAPIIAEMRGRDTEITPLLVHTGQHYDDSMSGSFLRELGLPPLDINLNVRSGSQAQQIAQILLAFEKVIQEQRPDWIVVVGDVNSTLACALAAHKLGVRVAHVEAGLRSHDRSMTEEINRILTDRLSDLLLTSCADADENLLREGFAPRSIVRVGNVLIDTLTQNLKRAASSPILEAWQLQPRQYAVATLHRPQNVDDPVILNRLVAALAEIGRRLPLILPLHPRTQARLQEFSISLPEQIRQVAPLGYMDCLKLWSNARLVVTDSGGLQEETSALGIPCLTLRENTERWLTLQHGSNYLVGTDPQRIFAALDRVLQHPASAPTKSPRLWDGQAAGRIVEAILSFAQSPQRKLRPYAGSALFAAGAAE